MHCVSISVGFYGLPAELGQRRAQRGAGDLQQPFEHTQIKRSYPPQPHLGGVSAMTNQPSFTEHRVPRDHGSIMRATMLGPARPSC